MCACVLSCMLPLQPSQTVYHFQFHGIPPTGELEFYSFKVNIQYSYIDTVQMLYILELNG